MPELPEVETVVRFCRPRLEGRKVTAFESRWAKNSAPSAAAVRRGIVGRRIDTVSRRAKFIVLRFDDGGHLLIHLRLSGRLEWLDGRRTEPRHVRAVWQLDNDTRLALCDARKFGRITYTRDVEHAVCELGVEPLEPGFTVRRLAELLATRRRQIKPLLLDQSVIAGLGNIYTDEALFRAGLHPLERSHRLRVAQIARLHATIRAVLRDGIRRNGASVDWVYPGGSMQDHFRVYGREGKPCVRCGAQIRYLRVGQRGTRICPRCQRLRRGDS